MTLPKGNAKMEFFIGTFKQNDCMRSAHKKRKTLYTLNGDEFLKQQISLVSSDLCDGTFSDFTIVAEGREIPVHRIILKSVSMKFESMFELNMKEKTDGKLVITNRSYEAVRAMIDYIYGSEVSNAKDVCTELLEIAEEYNIPKLKTDCELFIASKLNHGNAYESLMHAYKYNAYGLVESALRYICTYRKELVCRDKFSHLDSELKDCLLEYLANHL